MSIEDIKQDAKDVTEIAQSKCREIKDAIKKVLFIGAAVKNGDTDFSVIDRNTVGAEKIEALIVDIMNAIDVLYGILRAMRR